MGASTRREGMSTLPIFMGIPPIHLLHNILLYHRSAMDFNAKRRRTALLSAPSEEKKESQTKYTASHTSPMAVAPTSVQTQGAMRHWPVGAVLPWVRA